MDRLDKLLSHNLNITRSEAKALIKAARVTVNGEAVRSGDVKCGEADDVRLDGKSVNSSKYVYIMMNKPKGVVSASEDKSDRTVIDLLPDEMKRKGLFPAGRLDKDTTGFILITDDGEFAHEILSPKRHVEKTYIATLDKPFDDEVKADFESGMELGDEKLLKAELRALNDERTLAEVVIRQGIFHQIKRMFGKHGIAVTDLKRTKIGKLSLDSSLKEGESRYINEKELLMIKE